MLPASKVLLARATRPWSVSPKPPFARVYAARLCIRYMYTEYTRVYVSIHRNVLHYVSAYAYAYACAHRGDPSIHSMLGGLHYNLQAPNAGGGPLLPATKPPALVVAVAVAVVWQVVWLFALGHPASLSLWQFRCWCWRR